MNIPPKRLALFILPAVLLLAACAGGPNQPETDRSIRVVFNTDPVTLSPIGKSHRYSELLGRQITDSLVQYDSTLQLVPRLAESWEITGGGSTVTFRLREGVRWHDGEPFTARDVLRTMELARDPVTEARTYMAQFEHLVSLTAPDPRTVVAVYDRPYADVLASWTIPILPSHRIGPEEDLLTSRYAAAPVGCGPFRFVSYTPGQSVVLEANPDYWDGPPALDRIEFRILPDERTAYQALLTGDVDLLSVSPPVWREARESAAAAHLSRFTFSMLNVWYLAWNQEAGSPFTDAGTRQAMMLALDREQFASSILHGLARPGMTTYHPDSFWADPGIRPRGFDPEAAADLLKGAGWADGDGDGILERNGRPFRFTLLYARGIQEIVPRMAAWMQQSWSALGIDMEIESLEWKAFLERRNAGKFQAVMASLNFTPEPDQFELYHSSARDGGFNFFGLHDPEVDRLLEAGRGTFDLQERLRIYRLLQRRLFELEPLGCVFHFYSPVLHQPDLTGIEPSPLDLWRHWPGPRAWSRGPAEP